jgi:hypothetical protein
LTRNYHGSSEITVVITTNFQLPQSSKNDEKLPGWYFFPSSKPPYRFSKVVLGGIFLLIRLGLELRLQLGLGLGVRVGVGSTEVGVGFNLG